MDRLDFGNFGSSSTGDFCYGEFRELLAVLSVEGDEFVFGFFAEFVGFDHFANVFLKKSVRNETRNENCNKL